MASIWTTIADGVIAANKAILATTGIQLRDNIEFLKSKTDGIPSIAWSGLSAEAGIDTDHDVTVALGSARDTTDASTMVLAAAQTKRIDARWATGDAAGGLANAALISNNITVSFDNATSKMSGAGLFGGAGAGDTIIVVGSAANSGIHEITAATANDATLSVAPVTEGAGASITVYIIKAEWVYTLFIADDGADGVELGIDDSPTAANFLALAGVGTEYRAVARIVTDESANISRIIGTLGVDVQIFLNSGDWYKPEWVTVVRAELWSAGSGGAKITASDTRGGGGGAYDERIFLAGDLADTVSVGVGAGGLGGTNTPGGDGGDTTFGSYLVVPGSIGSITAATGASGASRGDVDGLPGFSGGVGRTAAVGRDSFFGGGGASGANGSGNIAGGKSNLGGGAGSIGSGTVAGGVSTHGGDGGNSDNTVPAKRPGGGGGAKYNTAGYPGAPGMAIIYSW